MQRIPPLLEGLVRDLRIKQFPGGQTLLHKDDPPLDVLILKEGVIKLHDIDNQGKEKILHLVRPYSIVPLAFFSGHKESMHWFYTALTDCQVYAMPAEELERRMREDSDLAIYLMNWFSLEVHELLVRLSSFGKTTARDKVVAALRFLGARHAAEKGSGWLQVMFPVNQQLLADMTGMTRESITTIMGDFQQRGIIRSPRKTMLEINAKGIDGALAGT